tara:strand:+ start:7327 stop:7554 length:228 start_codon:yes stop_codon:yes gene_type:complete
MTKVISISDKAYDALKSFKGENDSFTDVVNKLSMAGKKKSIMDFAGMWKDNKEIDKIFKKVIKKRKEFKLRKVSL